VDFLGKSTTPIIFGRIERIIYCCELHNMLCNRKLLVEIVINLKPENLRLRYQSKPLQLQQTSNTETFPTIASLNYNLFLKYICKLPSKNRIYIVHNMTPL